MLGQFFEVKHQNIKDWLKKILNFALQTNFVLHTQNIKWPKNMLDFFFFKVKWNFIFIHYFIPNLRQLHNYIFPEFSSFWTKNCSRSILQFFRKINYFLSMNSVMTGIKGNSKASYLVNMTDEWKFASQASTISAWSLKEDLVECYLDGILHAFW